MRGKQLYLSGLQKDTHKPGSRQRVAMHLDTLILLSVVAVLLLTFSYSLGVERGKNITLASLGLPATSQSQDLSTREQPESQSAQDQDSLVEEVTTPIANANEPNNKVVTPQKKKPQGSRYKIQVASFVTDNTAKRAAKNLESKGYPVLVMRKGKYAVVYVGVYENEREAKVQFNDLRQTYKDCILRTYASNPN